jgi:hypothetical protein
MGGYGSGRPSSNRDTVDNTRCIDIRFMRQMGWLQAGMAGTLRWNCNGQPSGDIGYRMTEHSINLNYRYRINGGDWQSVAQTINLETTPCHYGGLRYWFTCPRCDRRCALLCGAERLFYCRQCYNLPYQTQLEGPHGRACMKRNKLEKKLFGTNRRRMWTHTRDRLINELDKADDAANLALSEHFKDLYNDIF